MVEISRSCERLRSFGFLLGVEAEAEADRAEGGADRGCHVRLSREKRRSSGGGDDGVGRGDGDGAAGDCAFFALAASSHFSRV